MQRGQVVERTLIKLLVGCCTRPGVLGHSELRVAADLYAHLAKQTSAKAARHMDTLLTPVQTSAQ